MSQADLSRRTGIPPERISRLLAQPGNWTFNTLADLLFALTGAVISGAVEYPLDRKHRAQARPAWLEASRKIDDEPNKAGSSPSSQFVLY
ncbi:helix-turn-helix domain-containing protein [Mesorhizobium abyssinicae]